jgi:hypothetical protein
MSEEQGKIEVILTSAESAGMLFWDFIEPFMPKERTFKVVHRDNDIVVYRSTE